VKVLAVNSSPRKKSLTKTRLMLENLVQGLRDAGAEVDVVDIHDKTIEYCTACFACFNKKFNETELCIHKDDMTADLLPKWKAANLVVYASPVFFHSVTAKLKTFFERTLPVYVSFNSGDADGTYNPGGEAIHPSLVFLAVSGSPEDTAFDDYAKYVRCFDPVAEIYRNGSTLMSLPFCRDRVADVLAATRLAGTELVRDLKISEATMARIRQPLHDDAAFIASIADAHQTLLPGHRALMTFRPEAKRELRKIPPVATPAVASAPASSPASPRRRVVAQADADRRHDETLARLRAAASTAKPSMLAVPAEPIVAKHTERRTAASAATDIAIVGMSGRFASAADLDALWRVLESGENLVEEATRWDLRSRYESEPSYGRHGGFLRDIDRFDAVSFKIAGNEARYMDPQQRIFLEEAWHALEDSGYASDALSGTRCGVYVGCGDGDYRALLGDKAPPQSFWGNAASVIPARIAYYLNLKGPAVAIDTACSSSLVAIHMACQALRSGEVDMAVSGGVFVQCTPRLFDAANNAGMLSPTGRCYTFDARADGFVIGEGAGAVILKRLADARAAGDHIHGVIKASGTNQDGTTNGLTAPSALSQERLIAEVHRDYAIDPATIGFVECHGTGTRLGDPIEFNALARAFQGRTAQPAPCAIGSIKTNIGHAGSAAGVAGLLKVLLALRHRAIPASLNFERVNPLVGLDGSPFTVNTRAIDWPADAAMPRRGAVSSFGFSGTNAHLVVEEAPARSRRSLTKSAHLVALSARTPDQLQRVIRQLHETLVAAGPDVDLGDVGFTLLVGRKHGRCRFACVVRDRADLLARLANATIDARGSGRQDDDVEQGDLERERAGNAAITRARSAQGDALVQHLEAIAEHYRAGDMLRYDQLFEPGSHGRIPLPTTPYDRKSYWIDAVPVTAVHDPEAVPEISGAGDILLVPVFDPVDLGRTVPMTGTTVIVAAPGADPELSRSLRRALPGSLAIDLDASLDDSSLRARLEQAVGPAARVIWLTPQSVDSALAGTALLDVQESGVLLLFRAVRALLDAGYGSRSLDWTVITRQTASVHGETTHPDHAGIIGLVGSLAKEMKRWTLRAADLDDGLLDGAALAADLARLPSSAADTVFYGRSVEGSGRQWYRRRLIPASATGTASSPYRTGGVFVVFGGAGGIGRTWTEHVIREAQAQVVWIGRRPLDSTIEADLDRLALIGPRPHYISADCTRAEEVAQARAEIRARFGAVHGLVHSAIVLNDGAVATMSVAAFCTAFAPKVDLSIQAMRAFQEERPDFVLFFSSMISFTTSAGQGNYAAGCAFKDAFAERLGQELACPVKVMNWGYWGHVGVVSGESYRSRMAELGVASIEAAEAMQAITVLFSHGQDRLAFFRTAKTVDVPEIDATDRIDLVPSPAVRPAGPERLPTSDEMRTLRPQLHILQEIESAIAPVVLRQLAGSEQPSAPYLSEWRREAEALIARQPLAQRDDGDPWAAWDRQRAAWRTNPDHQVRCDLVDATVRALPGILAGTTAVTDVLFPQGSMRLVEGLYRQNHVADAFNRWVADTVIAEIEASQRPIRILEIGAGTGGTTSMVLQRLHETGLQASVADYCFTDVSSAFLRPGRDRFGASHPFLQFHVLDIEAPLAAQGLAEAAYDIVIAANVMHATQRIHRSIRHAKAALRPGGLLVMNELSRYTLLSHLTFGLLAGWWSAQDRTLRLPGGPALSPNAWSAVLGEEGFDTIAFPARDAHGFGQQIVVARSDGAIRRSGATAAALPAATVEEVVAPAVVPAIAAEETTAHEELILVALSECLGVELGEIERDEAFADYGLDSLNAVQLVQSLNQSLGTSLKPSDLYSHTSAARLARHLAAIRPVVPRPLHPQHVEQAVPAAPVQVDPNAMAIIGLSARFAGAETPDDLWQALRSGRSLVGVSKRWPGTAHQGAFFDDITTFDPGFFNISGVEATYMDPQQRFFLEEAWKAIEDAGYAGEGIGGLRGRDVGVFVGCYPSDYFQLIDDAAPAQAMWGSASSIVPARLAYFLDLRGPAVAIDTACSSSLVALHQACRSMAAGECEMALVGGVTLHSTARFFDFAGRAGMLSASGRSHAFEARADGFVAGEGVSAVLLKPLARALADGDHIHGVIRATGVNQDGASNGIIAPNGEAQRRLLRKTYAAAGIDPGTIQLVEAHGTGTKLGDPIEFDALQAQFAQAPRASCVLGSIKANVGHTLAAAGIAGLVKVLLALRHRTLPPAPDFKTPNPMLALQDSPFVIPTEPMPWPEGDQPRRAAVSSFGFSGTNVHVIVEQAPRRAITAASAVPRLFVLSAASAEQLRQFVSKVEAQCREACPDLAAMSFTLLTGRRHLAHRLAWVAVSPEEMLACLASWLAGERHASVVSGVVERARPSAPLKGGQSLAAWASRFVEGEHLPFEELFAAGSRYRVPLPTYPFAAEPYWVPTAVTSSRADAARAIDVRPQTLLHTVWQPGPAAADAVPRPANSIILATPQTQLLAQRIARHLPRSTVVSASDDPSVLITEDVDALIDCAGCAPIAVADLDWLAWPQHLAQAQRSAPVRYLGVTRGLAAVDADDAVEAPDGRALRAALGRMLQSEYRRLRSAHLDFAATASDEIVVNGVLAELSITDPAVQVAYRDGDRFTATLVELDASAPSNRVAFSPDHVLWITGGTRGLGWLCARHFATEYGVTRIVLTGQKPVAATREWPELAKTDSRYAEYVALQEQGVQLEVMALDLADSAAVQVAVEGVVARLGPIGGLLHCAGVADRETVAFIAKSADSMGRVLAPKTSGLDILWSALQGQPLDFAVLFSSLTAAVPALAVGQSDYAMANAYLDAFARHHARRARPRAPSVISLQWPNWKESGMGEVASDALVASGFAGLTDREGLALLDRVLAMRDEPVVLPAVLVPAPLQTAIAVPDVEALDDWLAEMFAAELRIPRAKLKPDTPFPDYGVDSILLAQINKTLGQALQCDLDPTLLYTHATLESLAQWLRENHATTVAGVVKPTPANRRIEPKAIPARATTSGAIAIVGMACRFPGAQDLDAYWTLLRSGSAAIAPVPDSRWNRPTGVRAGLLDEIDQFDPDFFGIGEADARAMSAQARIALEVALATLCHAGYRPEEIKGQPIGVYLGARAAPPASDDLLEQARHPVRAVGQNYLAAGISQYFDLHGPSLVIDTACSSALVAMQSCIQAMRCGDLDAALVGGVSILDSDGPLRMFRKRALYSESGAFHVFDGRADGVILGEGCGMVLLKPLELAQRDGDTVYALIDAVAVNSDGRSAGPSAPNIAAQIAVMQAALRASGRDAADISHIEVNGSGGEVSDLLELKAMLAAYGSDPAVRRSLGSIKPNMGHPLCAQGIASLIKVACMLHHRTVPPFLSAEKPMRHFDFSTSPFVLPRAAADWAGPRRVASVSAFADGGTNAHAILSASPETPGIVVRRTPVPLPSMARLGLYCPDPTEAGDERPSANFWVSA
jgi:acyl transferase domain-containing protein/acyl carrier protein/SAM-dependent methyltransferase